jgi:hypothetical protein
MAACDFKETHYPRFPLKVERELYDGLIVN